MRTDEFAFDVQPTTLPPIKTALTKRAKATTAKLKSTRTHRQQRIVGQLQLVVDDENVAATTDREE